MTLLKWLDGPGYLAIENVLEDFAERSILLAPHWLLYRKLSKSRGFHQGDPVTQN
jgi:hypothetical protein